MLRYKRYLNERDAEIPRSTKHYRQQDEEEIAIPNINAIGVGLCQDQPNEENENAILPANESFELDTDLDDSMPIDHADNMCSIESSNDSSQYSSGNIHRPTSTSNNSDGNKSDDYLESDTNDQNADLGLYSGTSNDTSYSSGNRCRSPSISDGNNIDEDLEHANNENTDFPWVGLGLNDEEENIFLDAQNGEMADEDFLYPGALITCKQSEALILSYVTRYHLSENALRDLLLLINSHTPEVVHRSRYFFLKDLNQDQSVTHCWYCECCNAPLTFLENNLRTSQCTNEGCDLYQLDQEQAKLQQSGCFFLHMPLRPQLVTLLNDQSVYSKLHKDRDYSDVPSGKIYRDLEHQQKIGMNDITLQWNTDGASATKSTKCSIWPIQVAVNELPYNERKQHLMLTGLWQGVKPHMDTFLRPFVDELVDLHINGIQLSNGTNVKVHCLLASVDSVARPLLQNIKQFNGDYGCSFCLKKGERVIRGAGSSHVYCGEVEQARDVGQHLRAAAEATETKTSVHGVKGPSPLMLIPMFNIITSFTPDYLHNVLLGVEKWFLFEWFDSKNSDEEWYLGSRHKTEMFESRLLSIKPPSEITRVPRSFLLDKKLWKASEFRSFLLYYSLPCLGGLLPIRFLKHWMLFVLAISIFLKQKINACDFQLATLALETFVLRTEELYNKEWMTFNLHLLLHVPKSVDNWGALWGSSTFIYEHFNGVLLNLFSGTQHISSQIFRNYNRVRKMNRVINSTAYQNWHPMAENLLKNLAGKYLSVRAKRANSLVVFGAARHYSLSVFEEIALESLLTDDLFSLIDLNKVTCYMRFHVNGIMCNTSSYTRLQKRTNDCVRLSNGKLLKIANLLDLGDNIPAEFKYICVGKELSVVVNSDFCSDGQFRSSKFLHKIMPVNGRTIAVCPNRIISKCVSMTVDDQDFACELVNSYERD